MAQLDRKLLVLDLDETLVHASEQPLVREEDYRVGPYCVYQRPYLQEFIAFVLANFHVGVWTSAGELYAAEVIERIFPIDSLRFVWTNQRCTRTPDRNTGEYRTIKNLKKLKSKGYPLESIIAVDDKPSVYTRNHGNLVAVQQFLGEEHDAELLLLMRYLDYLSIVPNVLAIEKRRWRAEVTGIVADKINVRKYE